VSLADVIARQREALRSVPARVLEAAARDLADTARDRWYTRVRPGNDAGRSGSAFVVRVTEAPGVARVTVGNDDPAAAYIHAAGTRTPLLEELLLDPARAAAPRLADEIARRIVRGA
jgi:hypothetical protein